MELIDLKSLNLATEESGHIIKFLARRRGITTKKLLSTIKLNLKRKNNRLFKSFFIRIIFIRIIFSKSSFYIFFAFTYFFF